MIIEEAFKWLGIIVLFAVTVGIVGGLFWSILYYDLTIGD